VFVIIKGEEMELPLDCDCRMKIGKYKGARVTDVMTTDAKYLQWLHREGGWACEHMEAVWEDHDLRSQFIHVLVAQQPDCPLDDNGHYAGQF
jgi:uncharacterized protein (DUF3820 family)